MPAGSGSHPSSDSSGAVEAECQQEAEATHPAPARGQWKHNASMKRKRMILMVMLMKMVSIISMISMISMIPMIFSNHGMGLHACYCCYCCYCYCWYCCYCCTYVCMYVVADDGGASVFTSNWPQPHETRVETDETMKLLLASATSLVTRVAYGRLKNCQAQRANQASDSSLPRGHQLPPPPSWR